MGKSGWDFVWIGGKKLIMALSFFLPCSRSALGEGCSVPCVVLSGVKIDEFR